MQQIIPALPSAMVEYLWLSHNKPAQVIDPYALAKTIQLGKNSLVIGVPNG